MDSILLCRGVRYDIGEIETTVVPRSMVEDRNARSIGINSLRKLTRELKAEELKTAVYEILDGPTT